MLVFLPFLFFSAPNFLSPFEDAFDFLRPPPPSYYTESYTSPSVESSILSVLKLIKTKKLKLF